MLKKEKKININNSSVLCIRGGFKKENMGRGGDVNVALYVPPYHMYYHVVRSRMMISNHYSFHII